jgi:FixJ family two-component response regulator
VDYTGLISNRCSQLAVTPLAGKTPVHPVGGLIRSAGLKVRRFASAQELLASSRNERPSCLVLAIQLPDINGFALQQELATKDIQMTKNILRA